MKVARPCAPHTPTLASTYEMASNNITYSAMITVIPKNKIDSRVDNILFNNSGVNVIPFN